MASSWTVTEALITLVISGCLSRVHPSACLGFSTSECILRDEEYTGPWIHGCSLILDHTLGRVRFFDQTMKSPLGGKVQALSFGLVFPKTVWIPLGPRGGWRVAVSGAAGPRCVLQSPHAYAQGPSWCWIESGGLGRLPFTSLKMCRTACLDLEGSTGIIEVKRIKRLQYRIWDMSTSSLENLCTAFPWSYFSQTPSCVGGRLCLMFVFADFLPSYIRSPPKVSN